MTFSTALRTARIDEAARLLREEAASLAEIGYCCGYADQPHFQRDFRRALNMSPGDYRRVSLV
jgi:AraC-like DNA-binding protein